MNSSVLPVNESAHLLHVRQVLWGAWMVRASPEQDVSADDAVGLSISSSLMRAEYEIERRMRMP